MDLIPLIWLFPNHCSDHYKNYIKNALWLLIVALEETEGAWIWFIILIWTWIWSLVLYTCMFRVDKIYKFLDINRSVLQSVNTDLSYTRHWFACVIKYINIDCVLSSKTFFWAKLWWTIYTHTSVFKSTVFFQIKMKQCTPAKNRTQDL